MSDTENSLREQIKQQEQEAERRALTPKPNPLGEEYLRKELHEYKPETEQERETRQAKNRGETEENTQKILEAIKDLADFRRQQGVEFRQRKQWAIRTLFLAHHPLWKIMRRIAVHGVKPLTIKSLCNMAMLELIPENLVRENMIDIEYVKAFGGRTRTYPMQETENARIP